MAPLFYEDDMTIQSLDINNALHVIGGCLFGALWFLLKRMKPLDKVCACLITAIGVNALWELLADYWHIFPWAWARAMAPDPLDVLRGGIGGLIAIFFFLYKRKGRI